MSVGASEVVGADGSAVQTLPWLLSYKAAGERKAAPWLLITGVPVTVKEVQVREALSAWRYASRYTPGLGGRLTLRTSSYVGLEGLALSCSRVTWDELAPQRRRLTLSADAATYTLLHAAARRRGQTLQSWALEAMTAAAHVQQSWGGEPNEQS